MKLTKMADIVEKEEKTIAEDLVVTKYKLAGEIVNSKLNKIILIKYLIPNRNQIGSFICLCCEYSSMSRSERKPRGASAVRWVNIT